MRIKKPYRIIIREGNRKFWRDACLCADGSEKKTVEAIEIFNQNDEGLNFALAKLVSEEDLKKQAAKIKKLQDRVKELEQEIKDRTEGII